MTADERKRKNSEHIRERDGARRAEKRCTQCGKRDENTLGGKRLCASCAFDHSIRSAEYQSRNHMMGLCIVCGKPAEQYGAWRCNEHIEKANKRRKEKKKKEKKQWQM